MANRNGTRVDHATHAAAVKGDRNANSHQVKRRPQPQPPFPATSANVKIRQRFKNTSNLNSQQFKNGAQSMSRGQRQPTKANRPAQLAQPTRQRSLQPSSNNNDSLFNVVRQPEARPISQDRLVAEVKGIYAGLVMVENKCIEVDTAQSSNTNGNSKLNNEQWQALIALHRALLYEYQDFYLASQYPSAGPTLRELASQYNMPAQHMQTFLYLAYNLMALIYETVPTFENTWIEYLGDLSRYRMAIEDNDI
ncbi:Telomerase-binding EST1A [Fusarium heterosporum]|uniref:Telomerase-binding EST1A n=1 Tax=Fusarium heterosporum TaxID=42747 RepID=A0A8H5TK49_FUSHE|nr:Telomerase-binding EST1A [Fusarium heterosporum]